MVGPVIKNENIILRPIKVSEAGNYVKWLKDSHVTKFLFADFKGLTVKKEENLIKEMRADKTKINWSIYCGKEHVGTIAIEKINKRDRNALLGIIVGNKNYWSKGVGSRALKIIIKYAFKNLNLNRLGLSFYKGNIGAEKLYKKCGFKKEGLKRDVKFINGKYYDEIVMGLLKDDYKKLNKKLYD